MKKSFCVIIIFVMIISSSAFSLADSDISNRLSDLKTWMMQNDYLFPQEMDTAIAGIDAAGEGKNSLSLMIIMDLFADSLELLHKYIFEGITPIN